MKTNVIIVGTITASERVGAREKVLRGRQFEGQAPGFKMLKS